MAKCVFFPFSLITCKLNDIFLKVSNMYTLVESYKLIDLVQVIFVRKIMKNYIFFFVKGEIYCFFTRRH